jgi:hypothetical protein
MRIQLMRIIQLVRWLACGGEVEKCPGGKPAYGFVASEVGEFAGEAAVLGRSSGPGLWIHSYWPGLGV